MTAITNDENLRHYKNRLSLAVGQHQLSLEAQTCLKYLQISSELRDDVLCYKIFSFGWIDPFYRQTLNSSYKYYTQIACV